MIAEGGIRSMAFMTTIHMFVRFDREYCISNGGNLNSWPGGQPK